MKFKGVRVVLVKSRGKLVIKIIVINLMWFGRVKVKFKFRVVIFNMIRKIIRVIIFKLKLLGKLVFSRVLVLIIIVVWIRFRLMIYIVEVVIME